MHSFIFNLYFNIKVVIIIDNSDVYYDDAVAA